MYYIERSCFFFSLSKRKNQNLYSIRQATRFLPLSLLALSFVCFTDPLLQGEKHNILYHIISFYNSKTLVVQINKNKNTIISLSPSLSLSLFVEVNKNHIYGNGRWSVKDVEPVQPIWKTERSYGSRGWRGYGSHHQMSSLVLILWTRYPFVFLFHVSTPQFFFPLFLAYLNHIYALFPEYVYTYIVS